MKISAPGSHTTTIDLAAHRHSPSLASVGQVTRLAETKTKCTPLGSDNSTSRTPSGENVSQKIVSECKHSNINRDSLHWHPPQSSSSSLSSRHSRARSTPRVSLSRHRNMVNAVERSDPPPLPPSRFGDGARINRPVRQSRTMSLERALSPEFFQEVRSQTPVM